MDEARKKTDKLLDETERGVRAIYANDPSLLSIEKKYKQFMASVKKETAAEYKAYRNSPVGSDERKELQKVYSDKVKKLTLGNARYKWLVREFARIMSSVNQDALNIVNDQMSEVYVVNYNQIAGDCEKVGIEVDG